MPMTLCVYQHGDEDSNNNNNDDDHVDNMLLGITQFEIVKQL